MQTTVDSQHADHRPDHTVTVEISTPDEDRRFTFPKTAKVADVISAAVAAFGLDPNGVYYLALARKPSEKMAPERTLVSYHVEDGTKLVLSSKGGGV